MLFDEFFLHVIPDFNNAFKQLNLCCLRTLYIKIYLVFDADPNSFRILELFGDKKGVDTCRLDLLEGGLPWLKK